MTHRKTPNRNYKSTMFAMIFSNKKELLELYNAITHKHYTDPDLLEVNTLENAIYMSMRNDLSFIIDSQLTLYEHQSTYNPNLPLRFLLYVSELYSSFTRKYNLYGTRPISIPAPQFMIFYNGIDEQPDQKILRLSELYTVKENDPALELRALMFNINPGHNQEILSACQTLKDYAEYTSRVRMYRNEDTIEDAVERAITECIREGILKDFLEQNRAEVSKVSIYEYNQEEHIRMEREEARGEGREEGRKEGREEGREKLLIEKCRTVRKLSVSMKPEEIIHILDYDEVFVHTVDDLIKKHSGASDADIVALLKDQLAENVPDNFQPCCSH